MTRLYSHDHLVRKLMRRPDVCAEVERIDREESRCSTLLKALPPTTKLVALQRSPPEEIATMTGKNHNMGARRTLAARN